MPAIDVSVLVPVRNEGEHIRDTAALMRAQELDGAFELIFLDGRSEDDTRRILDELAAEDPRIRVFDNPDRTIPAALNIGLREARGEYVARMDAHSWYPPRYLALGVDRLRRGDTSWVSGPAIPQGNGHWSRRVALALGNPVGQGGSAKWTPAAADDEHAEWELDTGVFAGVWRRETLERFGGWDEGWPANEDAEMAGRFLAAGERLVCVAGMGATYLPRDTLPGLFRQYWRFGFYRVKTCHRHPHALRRGHVVAPALALTTVAAAGAAPRSARRLARAGLGAYAAALGVLSARHRGEAPARDVVALPAVFATLHLGWGFGFLAGCARFGPPWRAFAGLLKR